MKIKFHTDPGHGWAEVPVSLLSQLAIADKITGYSYLSRDGRTAYLEEDCDLSTLGRALDMKAEPMELDELPPSAGDSFIRSLPHYVPRMSESMQVKCPDCGTEINPDDYTPAGVKEARRYLGQWDGVCEFCYAESREGASSGLLYELDASDCHSDADPGL